MCDVHRQECDAGVKASLTERQLEVLACIRDGMKYEEVGATLYIVPKTAKQHMTKVMQALQATNRTHAVALAMTMGLLGGCATAQASEPAIDVVALQARVDHMEQLLEPLGNGAGLLKHVCPPTRGEC